MASKCGKFEERLSAYLDGRLTPEEMAETSAHLEGCPECSALLEKMRRLDGMASDTSLDFDDALMEGLSERIAAGLENIDDAEEKPVDRKAKALPIWYRYAAVAASIAVVFFAGRMAFRETGLEPTKHRLIPPASQTSKPQPIKEEKSISVESSKPPIEPVIEEDEAISDQMTTPDVGRQEIIEMHPRKEKKDADSESEYRGKPKAGVKSSPKIAIPSPVMIETAALEGGGQDDLAEMEIDSDKMIASPATAEGGPSDMAELIISADKEPALATSEIVGRIIDEKTGEPLSGASVQLVGTKLGARADSEGHFVIRNIPPDTYDLIYSKIGYKTMEVADIPVGPEVATHFNTGMDIQYQDSGVFADGSRSKKGQGFFFLVRTSAAR